MDARKFLHMKDVAYMNRLSTSLDFNAIVLLMEEYLNMSIMKTTNEQIIAEAQAYYGLGENKDYEEGFIDGAYFIRRKSFNK